MAGDERPRWYVTTAIPYVNGRPHIGFALEIALTDALARFHRLLGQEVWFLTGTDDNSLTNVRAAEEEGVPTAELVERNTQHFLALKQHLDLSFDDFIRTSTDRRHLEGATKLWKACDASGDIYRRKYSGLYCVACEQFYNPDELKDGLCPEHLKPPELVEEENYFFRLSRYASQLIELIESDTLEVVPRTRKNEVLSFIRMGLDDFSISRSVERARGWGIPVPGDPGEVIYVWFDALTNYINALGYADDAELYRRFWVENSRRVHVIGKGILRFHAVYWPAMLLSAGVPLPSRIFVHGYITAAGTRMSKSLGNIVDPVDLVERYGTDALRYFLLGKISPVDDSDFTLERFVHAYNSDLADQLGNLVSRAAAMLDRYRGGIVPEPNQFEEPEQRLIEVAQSIPERVESALERFLTNEAVGAVWELVGEANRYVVRVEPWNLAKERDAEPAGPAAARLDTCLYALAEVLRLLAHHCAPFIPASAAEIARRLGADLGVDWRSATQWGGLAPGTRVESGPPLFPKIEVPAATEQE